MTLFFHRSCPIVEEEIQVAKGRNKWRAEFKAQLSGDFSL